MVRLTDVSINLILSINPMLSINFEFTLQKHFISKSLYIYLNRRFYLTYYEKFSFTALITDILIEIRRRMFATNRFVTSACSGQSVTSRLRSISSWHMFVTVNVSFNARSSSSHELMSRSQVVTKLLFTNQNRYFTVQPPVSNR